MNKYSQGTESFEQFAVRIAEMLKDAKNSKNYSLIFKKLALHLPKI
jgi:hypothetical protein